MKRVPEVATRSGYPKRLPEAATCNGFQKRAPLQSLPHVPGAGTYPLRTYTTSGTLGGFGVASRVETDCMHRASANQMLRLQEADTAIFVPEIGL